MEGFYNLYHSLQLRLWVDNKIAISTKEKDVYKEIKVYVNVTITNNSLAKASAEENVDIFKKPRVH
jgi:hypothetical protein